MEQDIDVELRDENSFNQFQDALHRQASNYEKKEGSDVATAHEKQVSSTDLDVHEDNMSSSRGSSTSNTFSEQKRPNFFTPPPSVLNGNSARYVPPSASQQGSPGLHQKSPSSYDFYDTFIPILASHNSTAGDLSELTQPPPALNHDGRSSGSSSSNTSSTRDNRSLDNLAKQLHHSQLFDKLPSRAASVSIKQRPHLPVPANNSSSELVRDYFHSDAINENYVVQVPSTNEDEDDDDSINGDSPVDDESKKNQLTVTEEEVETPQTESGPPVGSETGIANIEGNFDNNIATKTFDEEEPDVVFK
ncbi:hypothetical protein CXQ85_004432 [Candidozyma haemuli]|uniref:Uncharacterized protein n=1 Tax=Candidozyma haemuli TaxID=45357 RepID=A0A2V1ASU6_9ASCO|nr:hypothetical protein CXQ85_004432 [[Candida] haemuloni]PVH20919.1 hypothetical protein CXQ85_004432 [[Candida] haemuloni]